MLVPLSYVTYVHIKVPYTLRCVFKPFRTPQWCEILGFTRGDIIQLLEKYVRINSRRTIMVIRCLFIGSLLGYRPVLLWSWRKCMPPKRATPLASNLRALIPCPVANLPTEISYRDNENRGTVALVRFCRVCDRYWKHSAFLDTWWGHIKSIIRSLLVACAITHHNFLT